mgnify:FL=1|tara:strand:+ start:15011 stop:15892 length:882 start_codon:yes stop_codon:yes gene_type:complete
MEKKQLKSNTNHIRLDVYLQQHYDVSRVVIKKWITKQYISVNDTIITKPSFLLSEGDSINCHIQPEDPIPSIQASSISLDYIYEDTDLIIINKTAGLLVHKGTNKQEKTLVDYLKEAQINLYDYGDPERIGIVHRLDRQTEGLLVIAKSKLAYESLTQQFRNRTIKKRYYALLKGNLNHNIDVNQPIARHPKHRYKYCVDPTGKEALTKFTVKNKYNSMTLCDIELVSGRTHQIRVHAHYLGYPIIGDEIYSKTTRQSGQLLQAYELSFMHPRLNKQLTIKLNISKRLKEHHA